jgi:hypothetical protein
MKLPRFVGIVDLAVIVVVGVALFLPAREMYAAEPMKGTDEARFEVALAEARMVAHPEDGLAVSEAGRRLDDAGFKDWAIEETVHGARTAKDWRGQLAASVAYVEHLDATPALEYANKALEACHAQAAACPSWEEIRMSLYQQHLDAGVKSGIDPRKDPKGFRAAAEAALRTIRIKTAPQTP